MWREGQKPLRFRMREMFQLLWPKNADLETGHTLIELVVAIAIIGILCVAAFEGYYNASPSMRGDAALRHLQAELRQAREASIDQRRNVQVTFQGTSELVAVVQGINGGANTTLYDYFLAEGFVYVVFSTIGDTPDGYGNSAAVSYNCSGNTLPCTITFQSDGSVLDGGKGSSNGSIFIGLTGQTNTARAVTILSPTGKIKGWSYSGTAWH
jgi:prepilin-type N-terminal cleavage/methylation domain-containing protein